MRETNSSRLVSTRVPSNSHASDSSENQMDLSRSSKILREQGGAKSAQFSLKATRRFEEMITGYSRQLRKEAIRLSKCHQSEQVSKVDVDRAAQNLMKSASSRFYSHMGALGGILFGIGGSGILATITDGSFSSGGLVITFACSVLGAALMAAQFAKD
jgi:hypothetical protein